MSILYDAITYISEFNPLNLKITVSREKIKKETFFYYLSKTVAMKWYRMSLEKLQARW